jgi:hypothetical protein
MPVAEHTCPEAPWQQFSGSISVIVPGPSLKPRKGLFIRAGLDHATNSRSPACEGKHGVFTAATDVVVRW